MWLRHQTAVRTSFLALTNDGLFFVKVEPSCSDRLSSVMGIVYPDRDISERTGQTKHVIRLAANENYYDITHRYWQSAVLRDLFSGTYRWAG